MYAPYRCIPFCATNSPGDAGYLNCVMLQETADSGQPLYAKIGCMERETFTSTKLQLKL